MEWSKWVIAHEMAILVKETTHIQLLLLQKSALKPTRSPKQLFEKLIEGETNAQRDREFRNQEKRIRHENDRQKTESREVLCELSAGTMQTRKQKYILSHAWDKMSRDSFGNASRKPTFKKCPPLG